MKKPTKKKWRYLFAACVAATMPDADAKLKTSWDVGDYVQDGLIAHYDGIRNVGADLPHDSEAAAWSNLVVSTEGYAVLKKMNGIDGADPDHGAWTDRGYELKGYSYFETQDATLELGSNFTVQIVADIDSLDYADGVHAYHNIWGSLDSAVSIFLDRSSENGKAASNLVFKVDAYNAGGGTGLRPNITDWDGRYATYAFNDDYTHSLATEFPYWWDMSLNRWGRQREHSSLKGIPGFKYVWGGRYASNSSCSNCSKGKFYAWRAYSRMLTNDELAWNRMVDEFRFRDAMEPLITNAVVCADSIGRVGAESPGAYVVDGEHTFTAGLSEVDGCVYQAYGYKLETFDATSGEWGEAESHEGTSVTVSYDVSSPTSPVRITWLWRFVSGIERFDVHHYVQDGLVAHYDGIRNMGAGLPHDSTAVTWSNLVADTTGTGKFKKAVGISDDDTPDYGEWTEKGYRFKGYSYFETSSTLTLGTAFTVQIAGEFDMSDFADGVHKFHKIWASSDGGTSMSIGLDRSYATAIAGTTLYLYSDDYKGDKERPQFSWSGRYITAAYDETYAYIVQTPYFITDKWGYRRAITSLTSIPAMKYGWGGKYGSNNSPHHCCRGEFYTWRAYSRKLTDDELAWNRDVDEVRYYGGLPKAISNAVVVATSSERFAAAEDGVYLLTGSYEFTAKRRQVDGVTYAPGYSVETWNDDEEAWVKSSMSSGDSCILRQADGTAPRRIVWSWHKEGFSVIVR